MHYHAAQVSYDFALFSICDVTVDIQPGMDAHWMWLKMTWRMNSQTILIIRTKFHIDLSCEYYLSYLPALDSDMEPFCW